MFICLSWALSIACHGQRLTPGPVQNSVDSLLQTIYNDQCPGISIAIVENGKPSFKKSYGARDLQAKTMLDSTSNFNIGSLTKQFTALAILQLDEAKKLSLEDPISKFFPAFNKKIADVITVKELLTHSSGIVDHDELTNTRNMKHAHCADVLAAVRGSDSTYFPPGTHFQYSNTAYCLLALIIEKVSGLSYPQYLEQNIFEPLGMKQTIVWSEYTKIPKEAVGYTYDSVTSNFKRSGADENIFFSTEGDGGIYTSINDYLKWFDGLQTARITSRKLIDQARSSEFVIDKEKHLSYGYGWFINMSDMPQLVYHPGSNGGFRAYSYSIPAKNFLIIILSNRDDIDLEKLVNNIYHILLAEGNIPH